MHRLILDRAPFFATALSEPWAESNAKELTLYPQDIDSNITQESFEKTLQCIYGKTITANSEEKAAGILATACWLELQGLIACSTTWMLRLLNPATISWPIRLVTTNYYGSPGQVILTAAKSMLCRDGWEMPIDYWDDIPGNVVREVVSSDGFFVDGEWSRWLFARRLFNRRLKQRAIHSGLVHPHSSGKARIPNLSCLKMLRFDSWLRKDASSVSEVSERNREWLSLYSHSDVKPLLYLLEEGIHYIHLSYEQLQYIRVSHDFLGLPLVSEKVITNALWSAMELRQIIQNAKGHEAELGLSIPGKIPTNKNNGWFTGATSASDQTPESTEKGKGKVSDIQCADDSDQWDPDLRDSDSHSDKPQRFWIPSVDSNSFVGRDDIISLGPQLPPLQPCTNGNDADMHWTNTFATHDEPSVSHEDRLSPGITTIANPVNKAKPVAYSQYPPFRFAVEFANPKLLQENKRAYSRTVFYAGSFWRIYIQRKRSTKGVQLGVYLHRAKENEAEDGGVNRSSAKEIGDGLRTVNERIGMMERRLFRTGQRRSSTFDSSQPYSLGQPDSYIDDDAQLLLATATLLGTTPNSRSAHSRSMSSRYGIPSSPSPEVDRLADFTIGAVDNDHDDVQDNDNCYADSHENYFTDNDHPRNRHNLRSNIFENDNHNNNFDDLDTHTTHLYDSSSPLASRQRRESANNSTHQPNLPGVARSRRQNANTKQQRKPQPPTLPPYVDTRPTIRTYFKIYNPSKRGHALSVYQSAPDKFNFSQSWGWKSNSMLEDEDEDDEDDEEEGQHEESRREGRETGKDDRETTAAATAAAAALAAEATTAFGARYNSVGGAEKGGGVGAGGVNDSTAGAAGTAGIVGVAGVAGVAGIDNRYDGVLGSSGNTDNVDGVNGPATSTSHVHPDTASNPNQGASTKITKWKRRKGVLRFMVIIGNV